jgi:hypothetical protein
MTEPFEATASVAIRDGLVCITLSAPGAPETVLRLPKGLAIKMAAQINKAAVSAPYSFVAQPAPQQEEAAL